MGRKLCIGSFVFFVVFVFAAFKFENVYLFIVIQLWFDGFHLVQILKFLVVE